MKWIGQHIWDFISRFRSDVYLEATETGTIASGGNLGLDSNNKIVKSASPSGTIDLTSEVTGVLPVANGGSGTNTLLDNAILTGTGTSAITAESTLGYVDGLLIISSSDSNEPGIYITNSNTDAVSSLMRFTKSATGADGDDIGRVEFYADNAADEATSFAQILGEIGTAADTDEAGKLSLQVAASDGSTSALQQALTAIGHGTANKIDIGLGYGAASITTIAGDLDIDGDNVTAAGNLTITPGGTSELVGTTVTLDSAANIELEVGAATNYVQTDGIFRGSNIGNILDTKIPISPTMFHSSNYRYAVQYNLVGNGITLPNTAAKAYAEVIIPKGYTATACIMKATDSDNDSTIRCHEGSINGGGVSALAAATTFSSGTATHDFGANDVVGTGSATVIIEWTAGDIVDILHGGTISIEKTT